MLGDTTVLATSGANTAATAPERALEGGEVGGGGGGSSNSSEDDKNIMNRVVDEGERMNYGAKRWPRPETLALLKIRSDMDALFRGSTPKGPLWEEVSRKLAELGYHRSAKKCKEKFENVYKYHKRTKDGRTGKPEGKSYRFFDQLQALDHHNHLPPPPKPPAPTQVAATTTAPLPWSTNNPPTSVPSTPNPINAMPLNIVTPPPATNPTMPTPVSSQPPNLHSQETFPSFQNISAHLFSSSTSSSTASDDELEKGSRKRKWKEFFHRLTKNVIKKQEELQRKFLETVEKHEHERILREESWRIQEMARINREHEILIQERSSAAANDAAVIQFLQKISGQQLLLPDNINAIISPAPTVLPMQTPPPPQPQQPRPPAPPVTATLPAVMNLDFARRDNGDSNATNTSSSRWPKAEVEALINLRTSLDMKYQDNGPKGPLWEEISAGMKNLGYNRSAKRCKEKWENINKYFKKVKESNKKRSEDSKTCPYFFQLDALYKEKNKNNNESSVVNLNSGFAANPISTVHAPVMIRPEQQWPAEENRSQTVMKENERINTDQNFEEDEEDDEEDVETEDDDDDGGGFEVVASKPPEVGTNGERWR